MLVLKRRPNEGFRVGENISIAILDIDKNQVKIGITAPPEVKVVRNELLVSRPAGRKYP